LWAGNCCHNKATDCTLQDTPKANDLSVDYNEVFQVCHKVLV